MPAFRAFSQGIGFKDVEVCLCGPNSQFSIAPGHGLKLCSAVYKGREFMMPTRDVLAHGAGNGVPVLFPFPNRTKGCRYAFGGHECTIVVEGEEAFLHGIVVGEPFEFSFGSDEKSAWCEGVLRISEETPQYLASYPFPCELTLRYTLSAEGLRFDYTVENQGVEALPYGFALHPYFNKFGEGENVTIMVPADEVYDHVEQMPTGKLIPPTPDLDLRAPRPVSELRLNDVYHGLNSQKESVIEYKSLDLRIGLRASDDFVNMVVFTPPPAPGFCLENQTSATDYVNLHNQGFASSEIQILPPGERRGGWVFARVF
ncbi:MAG: aldose 1-epimerase [Christensenellaceae bacterium]|jgi:aldose 1-epimerase|nr:aldose 1-epimerase [Christensenellaceae bacterium]